jgi:hypothetical protein
MIKALADLLKLAISTVSFSNPACPEYFAHRSAHAGLEIKCRSMERACRPGRGLTQTGIKTGAGRKGLIEKRTHGHANQR